MRPIIAPTREAARLLWVCWRHKRPQKPPRGHRKGTVVESADYHDLRHIARFILMGIYTGSRSAPILRASIHNGPGRAYLDLDAELFHRLPEDMVEAENKRSPVTRLSDRMLAHLRRWRDRGIIASHVVEWQGRPVKSVKVGWKTAVTEAGLRGVVPHSLRHTAVSWFMQKRGTTWDASALFGMSEQMVREVYGHHHPYFQKEAANRLARK